MWAHDLIADGTYNAMAGAPWDQGMNGAAWALLALDSRGYEVPKNAKYTRENLIKHILDAKLSGGGWSQDGKSQNLDLDTSAMIVYALAPYYAANADVRKAVDDCLNVFKEKISEEGDYIYGKSYTCESTAQVIIAFAAMGIDPSGITNAKSGKSLFDGLMKYYLKDTRRFSACF